ncbi:hypothetical protein SRB17_18410 [Streptomyces sp. RB17]|nr:hypothetical protein [Streptomyces sp. RB17]
MTIGGSTEEDCWGTAYALWPDARFDWYPFRTPGLVSVPAAFLLGWLGSVTSP